MWGNRPHERQEKKVYQKPPRSVNPGAAGDGYVGKRPAATSSTYAAKAPRTVSARFAYFFTNGGADSFSPSKSCITSHCASQEGPAGT